jgi:hypothetical protein
MKKVKLFVAVAALTLVTAGVFAKKAEPSKARATNAFIFYGGNWVQLVPTLSTSGTIQAAVDDQNGSSFPIYQSAATTQPLYLP